MTGVEVTETRLAGDIVDEAYLIAKAAADRLFVDPAMQVLIDTYTALQLLSAIRALSESSDVAELHASQAKALLDACDWIEQLADFELEGDRRLAAMARRVWHQVCGSEMPTMEERNE